jgi:hypothetical protein
MDYFTVKYGRPDNIEQILNWLSNDEFEIINIVHVPDEKTGKDFIIIGKKEVTPPRFRELTSREYELNEE